MSQILFPNARNCDLFDDFLGAVVDAGNSLVHSAVNWSYSGSGSVTVATPGSGSPGEIHLLSGDVDTDQTRLFAAGTASPGSNANVGDLAGFEWRVKPSNVTKLQGFVGMGSNIASTDLGADSVGFRFTNVGLLTAVTRTGSVETETALSVSLDTAVWNRLVALKLNSGRWRFLVLDGSGEIAGVADNTAHLPTGALTLGANVVCNGTSSGGQHLKIDCASLRLRPNLRP